MSINISSLIKLKANSKGLGWQTRKLGAQAQQCHSLDMMGVLGESLAGSVSVHCEQNICLPFSRAKEEQGLTVRAHEGQKHAKFSNSSVHRGFIKMHILTRWG